MGPVQGGTLYLHLFPCPGECWDSIRAVLGTGARAAVALGPVWCVTQPGPALSCPTGPGRACGGSWGMGVDVLPRQCLHCHVHGGGKVCASLDLPWPFNFHFMYFILVQQKESNGFWWRGWLLILLQGCQTIAWKNAVSRQNARSETVYASWLFFLLL